VEPVEAGGGETITTTGFPGAVNGEDQESTVTQDAEMEEGEMELYGGNQNF